MNLLEISLRRPVFAWILMFALILFGGISFTRLGVSQMPDVNFPILNISVSYPGAAPEVVESEIINLVEKRLLSVEGIKEMRSNAQQGSAQINLEFDIDRNVDVALQEVQSALSQIRFPTGVDPAVISKSNPEDDPILFVSVYGNIELTKMIQWTDGFLLDQIQFLPGVGEVSFRGFPDRNLRIWIDVEKLKQLELTISDVVDSLQTANVQSAAGQYVEGKQEIRIRYEGTAVTPQQIADYRIMKRGGQAIEERKFYIRDVARVVDGLADIRRVAKVNGQTAVSIQVRKQRGANEVKVANAVIAKFSELKDQFPEGMRYAINVNYTKSTQATVDLSIEKIWVVSLITILVCFLFLGNFQSALNILFSIPTSIIGTFIVLYLAGFTLNLFTLLALTLSISIVVDDAIMLLENIVRHYRMGKNPYQAALDGSKEVLPAAIAASMAVLAVFLPVIFMDGVVGKFFFQFGIAMSAAVLISLLEAIVITPMRTATFLKDDAKLSRFETRLDSIFEKFSHAYQNGLKHCFNHKWLIVSFSMIFFIGSLFLFKFIKQEFVPTQDQNLIILTAQAKPGTSLDETMNLVEPLNKLLANTKEVSGYFISVGSGSVFLPIALVDRSERSISHTDLMSTLRKKASEIKGLRISMRDISARNLSTGRQNPIAFNLRGPNLQILNEKSQEIIKMLEDQKLAVDVDTDYKMGLPELTLVPDRAELSKKSVTAESVSQVLSAAIAGLRQGRYISDGNQIDIRFKVLEEQIKSVDDIKKLFVRNSFGNLIPLEGLVNTEKTNSLNSITRINRQRSVSVYGNLAPNQSQSEVLNKTKEIALKILPDGYSFNLEGASAGFSSSFKSLTWVLVLGILVAYMILAIQFNSFIDPISVLMSLPFSLSGALLILWMTGVSLNLFSFIGLIVLMGIAKKNSIMLVEFTVQKIKHENLSITEALLKACPVRLRPVLMTSVATFFASLPLVWGSGLGIETRRPMGLVIIGGIIVSTVFTLFIVPIFYLVLARFKFKKANG
ncbi:MAG: acriflavin resistance protein [Bdellovibrionales bacterium RIFCSPHIGHO2_01_FULL_40_29]|nr:MAG: acriflavin resistance protein [Bdellovibrionales bacterium RIFCSPHIGHO2_01_FULL_40_29]OFZ33947.1 MAG: acriflavin resistance protein [Bdellovibrionales bacterium RIFCSPHIGHO2_02_FULL_40_15]